MSAYIEFVVTSDMWPQPLIHIVRKFALPEVASFGSLGARVFRLQSYKFRTSTGKHGTTLLCCLAMTLHV